MGFGGFFNYNKPGPGVSKDEPQKRSFFYFFEIWFKNVWKLLPSGCLYVLFGLLLIPSGLGSAGMTNIARNMARDKHSFGVSDFFETIKKNWKQALPLGIINVALSAAVIVAGVTYFRAFEGFGGMLGTGLMISVFFVISVMNYYAWLILITFNMPLKKILKNSFYFVFINLPKNLLVVLGSILWFVISAGICLLCWSNAYIFTFMVGTMALVALLFYPGFHHLLVQFCVFPAVRRLMIDPYYEQNPDADIELRRSLGLPVPEDEEEEETVFDDERLLPESEDE